MDMKKNSVNNKLSKIQGFTLPEMLISISLGLFLSIMLIKVYLWQDQLQRQMQDMIFLNHNGLLAMQMLAHTIRVTDEQIKIIQNGHKIEIQEKDKTNKNIKTSYDINEGTKSLRRTRPGEKKPDTLDVVSGIDSLTADFVKNNQAVKIQLHFTAPYGMTEKLKEIVFFENYCP